MQEPSKLQLRFSEFINTINQEDKFVILPSDKGIRTGVEAFLMYEANREAMQRLDFNHFNQDGFNIENNKYDLSKVYQQHCSDESKFRLLWLHLVRLCNFVLPESHQLTSRQKWLEESKQKTGDRSQVMNVAETFSSMPPGIGGPVAGLVEQLAPINPSQVVGKLTSVMQPMGPTGLAWA